MISAVLRASLIFMVALTLKYLIFCPALQRDPRRVRSMNWQLFTFIDDEDDDHDDDVCDDDDAVQDD